MADDTLSPPVSPRGSLAPTPILFDHPNEDSEETPSSVEPSSETRPRAFRINLILTALSLCLSIMALGLDIALAVIAESPVGGYWASWTLEYSERFLLVLVCSA